MGEKVHQVEGPLLHRNHPSVRSQEIQNRHWENRLNETKITRVVLADDHAKVRAGIRMLLEPLPDVQVIGEASDGLEALNLVLSLAPDILLLDMEMPKLSGTEVASRLREHGSEVRILAVSTYDDQQYILNMLNNGAAGYLTKDEVPEILVNAVRGIARGEYGWVSKRVAKKISPWNQQDQKH
jgi:DNA-binding NarL/FixJ family response regulator